jgi:hypothetical protein
MHGPYPGELRTRVIDFVSVSRADSANCPLPCAHPVARCGGGIDVRIEVEASQDRWIEIPHAFRLNVHRIKVNGAARLL